MRIDKLSPKTISQDLSKLLQSKYGTNKHFNYFMHDLEKSRLFCCENDTTFTQSFALYNGNALVAHVSLIKDGRLKPSEAFFGFMEFPDDATSFSLLWESLINEARAQGVSVLKGPVNGSVWHQYRCTKKSDGTDPFIAEPVCEPYYYAHLASKNPSVEIQYYSGYREPFDIVLDLIDRKALEKMSDLGFTICEVKEVTADLLQKIAKISRSIFSLNWGYTELNEKEFVQLYSLEKMSTHLSSLYALYGGGEMIGFCSTSAEDEKTLILKTMCILPQYQGLGLGNALAYKIHQDAGARGFTRMIYALIREGNSIKNFPKDKVVIFREYATFEFRI
jgi:GNAT superfamily N-acetyltransferase